MYDLNQFIRLRSHTGIIPHDLQFIVDHSANELSERIEALDLKNCHHLMTGFNHRDTEISDVYRDQILLADESQDKIRKIGPMINSDGSTNLTIDAADVDLVSINLALAWMPPTDIFEQILSVLKPGGIFMFSTFGPQTLNELKDAWLAVDTFPHVHNFPELQQLGDALLATGFTLPVVDSDILTVEYDRVEQLITDLQGSGFTNLMKSRRKTLTGQQRYKQFLKRINDQASDGFSATFEFIYGYAKKPDVESGNVRVEIPRR